MLPLHIVFPAEGKKGWYMGLLSRVFLRAQPELNAVAGPWQSI